MERVMIEKNTIKSQDSLIECNNGKRSSETLIQTISKLENTIEELEKVKKENEELKKELKYMYNRENVYVTKFNIALDCVLEYSVRSNWKTTEEGESCYFGSNGYELAEETIDKLKKITKVDESKCERLQKQLDIAFKALNTYSQSNSTIVVFRDIDGWNVQTEIYECKEVAKKALKEIEELNK